MKKCQYYEAGKSVEENKKHAEAKIAERNDKKRNNKDKKNDTVNDGIPHKGTIVQLPPPRTEHTGMCLITEINSELYSEPCNLMGAAYDEIDFIYDTGTVSGAMGPKECEILFNVENEDVLIETVTGEKSISKEYGDTVFGKPAS